MTPAEVLAHYVRTLREIRLMGFDVNTVLHLAYGEELPKPTMTTAEERKALLALYREQLPDDLKQA